MTKYAFERRIRCSYSSLTNTWEAHVRTTSDLIVRVSGLQSHAAAHAALIAHAASHNLTQEDTTND